MEAPEYYSTTQLSQVEKVHQHHQVGAAGMGVAKSCSTSEHFVVEDLLDFSSNEDGALLELSGGGGAEMEVGFDGNHGGDCSTVTNTTTTTTTTNNSSSSSSNNQAGGGGGGRGLDCTSNESSGSVVVDPRFAVGDGVSSGCFVDPPCLSGELCLPYDELAELEWLSNFVEESFSSEDLEKLQLISGGVKPSSSYEMQTENSTNTPTNTVDNVTENVNNNAGGVGLDSEKPPAKARSKRSRAAPVNWTSRLLLVQGSSAPVSTMSESELLVPPPPPAKVAKCGRKKESSVHDGLMPAPDGRKCLHCATDKTPQWRTGPLGPKTLCNACGVRYKSGRLVPEYRPAASPTFVMSKHSNSHRKVLELRRQKELAHQQQQPQPPPPPPPPQPQPQQQQQGTQFMHHHHHPAGIFDTVASAGAGNDEFLNYHQLGPDFRQLI